MKQMQRVLWTKGAMLTPQHLQLQDRFLEDLIGMRLSALSFAPWGFSSLDIDREALGSGVLALSAAAGLFPDGLAFDIPGADPAPAPKPLADAFEADQNTVDTFLAIPEYRPDGHNVSTSQVARDTRYQAEVLMRRDENTGLAEKPIQVARKNLRILVGGESREGSVAMPLARITRTPGGELELDPRFVPPVLDVASSDYLMAIARRLVELLSAKSTELSGTRRQRGQSLADFGIADIANFWLLYTANTYLPVLRHLFERRGRHPAVLFESMLSLAGALTTFSSDVDARSMPTYDHLDLSQCFTALDGIVRHLLETVVPTNYVSLPLRLVEPPVYAAAIDQERYLQAPYVYLAMKADLDKADLIEKTRELVKISSHDRLDHLYKRGLPGVPMTHVATPPSAIPVKMDHQYFLLDRTNPEWDEIALARSLAAYVPSAFPNPQLELVLILPEE
ncbi:MAG: type VI secretion system baseplate subunit TssK [Gemmatimonadota bacterium]|jgi:type VI secretion system protein ImpJ